MTPFTTLRLPRVATVAFAGMLGLGAAAEETGSTEIYEAGEIIISLNLGFSIEHVNTTWGTATLDSFPVFPRAELFLLYADGVGDLESFAEQMAQDPAINEAEANYIEDTPEGVRQMMLVAVTGGIVEFEDQEITQRIGLTDAHAITRGAGVTIALLDTGVDPTHVALQGHLTPFGYDFLDDDPEPWEMANGIDDDGDSLIDDGFGHGTMVAGILALVAPEAEILPVRILDDEGRGDAWQITKATRYAVEAGADVINMSFGVPRTISSIGHQVSLAESLNIVVVAGAGNQNREDEPYYPAIHSKAMMVTALDSMDIKADFADWNSNVLVSAPGTGVRSAYPGGEWALGSGCSFAAPWVTGEVALIRSLYSGLRPDDVEEVVVTGVDPIYQIPGNEPFDGQLGAGRLFLPRALAAPVAVLAAASSAPTRLRAFPNPTAGTVRVRLNGEIDGALAATVHDVTGRRVVRLRAAATELTWDGSDEGGRRVGPGVYYVRIEGASAAPIAVRILR